MNLFLLASLFKIAYAFDPSVIETKAGKVSGIVQQSFSGHDYYSYLGIPFAEPPTDDLRFRVTLKLKHIEM